MIKDIGNGIAGQGQHLWGYGNETRSSGRHRISPGGCRRNFLEAGGLSCGWIQGAIPRWRIRERNSRIPVRSKFNTKPRNLNSL